MIKWVIPSYGRADALLTPDYVPWAVVWVAPEEYEEYSKNNPGVEIKVCPEGVQGRGKGRVMNWLLDTLWEEEDTEGIVILDDDIRCLRKFVIDDEMKVKTEAVPMEYLRELVEGYIYLAKEWGVGLMSFNLTQDPLSYNEHIPFRHHAYLDGGLQGFCIDDGLRYDEDLTVKEDVDMMLQQVKLHRKTLRVDKYYLSKRSFEGQGGSQVFRVGSVEKEQFRELQRKWGKKVIRPNLPASGVRNPGIRGLGAAVKVRIPIGGE